jgi:hypothetical protein
MMSDASQSTVLVVDGGLFFEFALRLSRGFKRTLYHCDITETFPRLHTALIGDGFEGAEVALDLWDAIREADVVAFPDCTQPGLQAELVRQGKPVWGSRKGVRLEWFRREFMERLRKLDLPVADYQMVYGLSALRSHLRDLREQYIKVSRWRGNMETTHWIDWRTSSPWLDDIAVEFGGAQEDVAFLVFPSIDAVSEVGYDGYFAGGRFPKVSASGVETKDKGYFGAVIAWDELPEPLQEINEAMAPVLADFGYANFWAAELRLSEDGKAWFTDPCCRHASPAGECQLELWKNLPEIVYAGAHGECLDPEPTAKFAAQALMEHRDDKTRWRRLVIPDDVSQWVKLYNPVKTADEVYDLPPLPHSCESVGSVIGLGNTPVEAVERLKEHAAALEGQPVEVRIDSLVDAAVEIEAAAQVGVDLVNEAMPSAAEVMTKDA